MPDPLADAPMSLPADVALAISRAERAVDALNRDPPGLADLEVLARRLLRAESVASSRIEGLVLSQRTLARAEAEGTDARDETARSILGNVAAMERAVALGARTRRLGLADLLSIHQLLMTATGNDAIAGKLRDRQNWLGGNPYNPANADFVPPPPELVEDLMTDLVGFLNRTDVSPVMQAAIAHAQFETIHPFADGNGRVGRALIHVLLRRRGLAPRYVPPVSLILAADAKEYVAGLTAFRKERRDVWLALFARAVERAAHKAVELATRLADLQRQWREQAGHPRAHSSAEALIRLLPAHPVVTLATAQTIVGRSKQAANEAIAALVRARVLRPVTLAKRNRAFEARDLFALVEQIERELAMPRGSDEPARPVPRKPTGSRL